MKRNRTDLTATLNLYISWAKSKGLKTIHVYPDDNYKWVKQIVRRAGIQPIPVSYDAAIRI